MSVFALRDLAAKVGGEIVAKPGDQASAASLPDLQIFGVADLAGAREGQLSFLGNSRYLQAAQRTKASVILVSPEDRRVGGFPCAVLVVASPSLAFSQVAALFAPEPIRFPVGIHPTAVIAPGVVVGEGASIQPYAVIEAGVRIGARAVIGAGSYIGHGSLLGDDVFIHPRVTVRDSSILGSRVVLHSGTVVGSDGFGYEFKGGAHQKIPQTGYVQIDDDVEIGANAAIDRGRFGRTWIGKGTKIDNLVQIAHNVVVGAHSIIVAQAGISGSTILGNHVTLAGQAGLAGHLNIGDGATIAAQSGIAKDVPAKTVVAGRHALPLRESLKIEALLRRLPELFGRVKAIEEKK
ncbi:UDP-3-O-[3-hydroxymyristoyl] glucosamine N-acyltransferase [Verrucomicrobium sp. GAS474]|uniref:UDP-3-O-(3-hydroxymyristoyl)glucosamine N-acyltransferase n=1 Tax=Verrucomicrobium sp. GAS474 TaxID=1882831 RepID=UPI00087C11DD|nr:UDP-3-O-(3-hydroxymyristoyl)glucosamine N-acyltransferase [Verrucomicrobium sp. GAS474]SDU10234.1 UDP-3-O-[3-hydroxymyristoyl] glucosamine N-acyltransferase [Verrucomicrobium sp. GAS474]